MNNKPKNPLIQQWEQYDCKTDIGLLTLYQHQNRTKYIQPYQITPEQNYHSSQQLLPKILPNHQTQINSQRKVEPQSSKKQINIFHPRALKGKYRKIFGNRNTNRLALEKEKNNRIDNNSTMNHQVIKMKQYNFAETNQTTDKQRANSGFKLYKEYCTIEGKNQRSLYSREQLSKILKNHHEQQYNRLSKIKFHTKQHKPINSPRQRFKTIQNDGSIEKKSNELFSDRKVHYLDCSITKLQTNSSQISKKDSKEKRKFIKEKLKQSQKKSNPFIRQSNLLNSRINKPISISFEDTQNAKINENRIKQLIKSYLSTVHKRQFDKKLTILQPN